VTLRRKLQIYLVLVHVGLGAAAVYFVRDHRAWLIPVEILLVASVILGVRLVHGIFGPIELIRTGVQFIQESDFTSRFREVGQPEMDELTRVYNKMADHLRDERVRVREQHHFLDQVIRASPSGIVTFDYDDRIALVNASAERILGQRSAELTGRRLTEIDTPFARSLCELKTYEARVIPLEGIRRVKCQRSQFLDRGFARAFLMIEELTEELRRSERAAYEKIIRTVSHEINNSIGASGSLLESCLTYRSQLRDDDRADFENALNVAISRGRHLNAFVKSYADVIRLPAPELRPCDVKELLEDIAFLMGAEAKRRSIAWCWNVRDPIEPVLMDKNQMEQVFVNVLQNAMEAIGSNGTITLRLAARSVEIEDTGHGISPEARLNLFTPFFSTKDNGRGIGLTLVQEILTRHKFHFALEGPPGGPTRFTIRF
jgi:two-component system, NtrC family, nitrogen regulation sensor histidine kinase NtrY